MILQLDIEKRLRTLDQVRDFVADSAPVDFRLLGRGDAYGLVRRGFVRRGSCVGVLVRSRLRAAVEGGQRSVAARPRLRSRVCDLFFT